MARPFSGKPTVSQIRAHRRGIRHNVGGIRGLAVQIDGDEQTRRALALLPAAVQRRVLRQALAAAARPVRAAMKSGAREYSSKSPEAFGVAERSLIVKVSTSKKTPSVAYAVVGAARGYAETVQIDRQGEIQSRRVSRRGKKLRTGVHKVHSRQLKNIGPQARKARLDPRKGLIQRRKPTRYLHLIELGGKTRRIRAGHFMDRAARSANAASVLKFNERFAAGMKREFDRMAAKGTK